MIEHRPFLDHPPSIQKYLRSMVVAQPSFGASWTNGDDATAISALNDPEVWVDSWLYFSDGPTPDGWAMAARSRHCPNATVEVSVFVEPDCRDKGVATLLFNEIMESYRKVIVNVWDEHSNRFYRKMAGIHIGQVVIMNYWNNSGG